MRTHAFKTPGQLAGLMQAGRTHDRTLTRKRRTSYGVRSKCAFVELLCARRNLVETSQRSDVSFEARCLTRFLFLDQEEVLVRDDIVLIGSESDEVRRFWVVEK
ncbi:uncharacterized protein TNCT_164111 [Trichonephila clavata]|uniref:Uncharacterized protein n=1 Tax=Trichonephila clavata TaxID=2740835 RepID=A0A8X6LDG8_TRICU|nr:uncharacterized protein TNCT_164111 [Trichonephila clavata]